MFGIEKLEWCGGEKMLKIRLLLYSFRNLHERDGRTDRHCMTA